MKYSILGFNQEKIVNYNKDGLKCDLTDLLLLNYIIYAQANPKMKHCVDDDMKSCVWLCHEHILKDLPILNMTEGTLRNRLTKLRKMELLTSKTLANENSQGTRTYYRTTSLLYDMLFETTSFKNDMIDEPRHSKMTSDTFTNSNTKVNKLISKDINTEFDFGKQKPKKQNLYTKCVSLIDQKTNNNEIRSLLIDWLNMLLEKYKSTGKVLYVNVFKGKLNMLNEYDEKDWKKIIKYNIQKGYEGFYPIPSYNYRTDLKDKPWEKGVKSEAYTEEEKRQIEREREEMEARGERVWY